MVLNHANLPSVDPTLPNELQQLLQEQTQSSSTSPFFTPPPSLNRNSIGHESTEKQIDFQLTQTPVIENSPTSQKQEIMNHDSIILMRDNIALRKKNQKLSATNAQLVSTLKDYENKNAQQESLVQRYHAKTQKFLDKLAKFNSAQNLKRTYSEEFPEEEEEEEEVLEDSQDDVLEEEEEELPKIPTIKKPRQISTVILPGLRRGQIWTPEEDKLFCELYTIHGKQWKLIHESFPEKTRGQVQSHGQYFLRIGRLTEPFGQPSEKLLNFALTRKST